MSTLLEPFGSRIFLDGLTVAVLAGALLGLVGTYVVLRGMSYIGHGMSHAVFGGAAASFVMDVNFYAGAGLWGFVTALLVNQVARRRIIGADAAIGVITTASFAIGIALITATGGFTRNLEGLLFGNILGVTTADIVALAAVGLAATALVFLGYRRLLFTTFDPEVAQASGVRTARVDALFSLVLAGSIVVTLNILGVTMMAAAIVIPPVVARMLTHSFARMLWLSVAIGAASGAVGMYLSWYLDVASGASVVITQTAAFVLVYLLTGAKARARLAGAGHI